MTITFKDATTQPEKMRPLTYGDLRPGDVFRFHPEAAPLLKLDVGHAFFMSGNCYPPPHMLDSRVQRLCVTATIDRVESEVRK